MPRYIEKILINEFKEKPSFTREELYNFFKRFDPELKEGTLGWRIYDLKKKNIIKSIRKAIYAISFKSEYKPALSRELSKLSKRINVEFDDVNYCIWDTNWLNEFAPHQASKRIIIIEVEKEFLESIYFELNDFYKDNVFLTPSEKAINYYVAESSHPIVIKRLITRSPINKRTEKKVKYYTPALEKILIDIFIENKLFYYVQGAELIHIFENAIKSYDINYTKLFAYAKRREKEDDIKAFLTNNMYHIVKDIIDV